MLTFERMINMLKKHCGLLLGLASVTVFTSCALFATMADENKMVPQVPIEEELTQQQPASTNSQIAAVIAPNTIPATKPLPTVQEVTVTPPIPRATPQQPETPSIVQQPTVTPPVVESTPAPKPSLPTPVKQKTTKTRAS
jgi:hypothetical protein